MQWFLAKYPEHLDAQYQEVDHLGAQYQEVDHLDAQYQDHLEPASTLETRMLKRSNKLSCAQVPSKAFS